LDQVAHEPSVLTGRLGAGFRKLFDIRQKPIFSLTSILESTDFSDTSCSVMSASAVPSTSLMSRVSLPSSSLSLAPTSSSARDSVLVQNSVPAFSRDGILGKAGDILTLQELGKKSSVIVNEMVFNSVAPSTLKIYKLTWNLFKSFGKLSGVDVEKYNFDFTFICQFFLYRLQSTSSLSSILSSRSAISFMWKIHSSLPCPTESNFVSLFIKGISRKFKQIPKKAYAISYEELEKIFTFIVGDSALETLPFTELRFIAFLLTSYSSFGRYEEISNLKIEDIVHEDEGFILTFKKGKSYQYGESHIGVLSNLPRFKFNPAKVFSLYLDKVALIHEKSNTSSDFLFPSLRKSCTVLHSLDKPVPYSVLLKKFKFCVNECEIQVGLSKVGLHSLRRGGVTYAVRAGAPHSVVAKCMRVKSEAMVGYYATLSSKELRSASNLAF
jgi:integrase